MTYTYAVLDVPATVYAAVRTLLDAAGYQHAFHEDDGEVIDMHGIALRSRPGRSAGDITVSSLLSSKTQEGRVEFAVNSETVQMDLSKTREVIGLLQGAVEAAVSDELIFKFLTTKIGLSEQAAGADTLDNGAGAGEGEGEGEVAGPHEMPF